MNAPLLSQTKVTPPIVHEVLRSPGRFLDTATRRWLEPRIGDALGPAQASLRQPQLAAASLVVRQDSSDGFVVATLVADAARKRLKSLLPAHHITADKLLAIGRADDPMERQAEQTAVRAMRASAVGPAFDFSRVQIHSDRRAAASAQALDARAYTAGGHIVFGDGEYAPQTSRGRRLLAHELTHVVQQSDGVASTVQRDPAPAGAPPATTPAPAKPEAEPSRPEGKLAWR